MGEGYDRKNAAAVPSKTQNEARTTMKLLCYSNNNDEYSSLEPLACSRNQNKLEEYLGILIADSEKYDIELQKYEEECKRIIKEYLLNNYDAITGWSDVRSVVRQESFPPSDREKDGIIAFLCESYRFSLGKNIVETSYQNSLIGKYCDINKLRKPYPTLPQYPIMSIPYYKREFFEIIEVKDLDE